MKFEVKYELMDGTERSFITKDYEDYTPEFGVVNGIFQIGFIKEGAKRRTWTPLRSEKYGHNVKTVTITEATTGRVIERFITDNVSQEESNEMEEKKMTVKGMRVEAKELGIKGYSRMSKEDLKAAIESKKSSETEEITIKMYAFTGMFIGKFPAKAEDGVVVVDTKRKGELKFKDGLEITAPEKARWANRIEVM